MNWNETEASKCRYGDVAGRIFEDGEVIWEHSEADCQGSANVLVKMPDGKFGHYEWTYGSCSGCDEWESRELTDDEIEEEMRRTVAWFDTVEHLKKYLNLEDKSTRYPRAQSPTAGSLPGMLRFMAGGIGEEFREMGRAFLEWEEKQNEVS